MSILGNFIQEWDKLLAPDNLGYGLTEVSNKKFDYNDWVNMINEFTNHILSKYNKLVVLFGMSIGGMLAYQVTCKNRKISGLIVSTLIDPRDKETMIYIAKNKI